MRAFAILLIGLAACQPVPEPEFPELDGMTGVETTECTGQGGRIAIGPLSGAQCVRPLADANQLCAKPSDCAGFCLAADATGDSGQCSAEEPLYGCHDVIVAPGIVRGICVE